MKLGLRLLGYFFLIIFPLSVFHYIQFSSPFLPGTDAYYHLKLAHLMTEASILDWPINFPFLPKTVLSEDKFVDHHFLFHVFLIPFIKNSLLVGGKWAAIVCASLGALCFVFVAPKKGFSFRLFFVLSYFAISAGFLYRMSLVRAQSLSLVMLFLIFYAARKEKHLLLMFLAFIYVWLYNAFPLLIIFLSCFVLAEFLITKKVNLKIISYPLAGAALGIIINPYFPDNVFFLYHHLIDKFTPAGYAVKVGNEWYPYPARSYIVNLSLASFCFFISSFCISIRKKLLTKSTLALFIFSFVLLLMVLKSRRFVELFPPFSLLTLLWILKDLKFLDVDSFKESKKSFLVFMGVILGSMSLMFISYNTVLTTRHEIAKAKPYLKYSKEARWLELNTSPGSLVITSDWDEFPRLFHFNHHNHYLVGLDPYFLYAKNKELFKAWEKITRGNMSSENLTWTLKYLFKSEYVFVDKRHEKMEELLVSSPEMRKVFSGDDADIFKLTN